MMQRGGVNISTTLLGRHQCHRKSFSRVYLLNKVDVSRLGAVEVCVYVTDQALPCDLDVPPPSEKRVTQDTRATTCNLLLRLLLSYISPTTIIKPLSPGCGGLSHRQPESGGSPISFVHFSPSFSAEPILPPGWARPVPVLLRLDSAEATEMKSLEVNANNFPQPGLCISHIRPKQLVLSVRYTVLALHSQNNGILFSSLVYFGTVAKK